MYCSLLALSSQSLYLFEDDKRLKLQAEGNRKGIPFPLIILGEFKKKNLTPAKGYNPCDVNPTKTGNYRKKPCLTELNDPKTLPNFVTAHRLTQFEQVVLHLFFSQFDPV